MKKIITALLTAFIFSSYAQAYTFDQYTGKTSCEPITINSNNQTQTSKIYDSKGQYQGKFEKKENSTKFYDNKGQFKYQMIEPIERK